MLFGQADFCAEFYWATQKFSFPLWERFVRCLAFYFIYFLCTTSLVTTKDLRPFLLQPHKISHLALFLNYRILSKINPWAYFFQTLRKSRKLTKNIRVPPLKQWAYFREWVYNREWVYFRENTVGNSKVKVVWNSSFYFPPKTYPLIT